MKQVTGMDYNRRASLKGYSSWQPNGPDEIEGLKIAWDECVYSIDGAWYHCWIPKGMTRSEENELLGKFKAAARRKGDPVKFSWDYLPEGK